MVSHLRSTPELTRRPRAPRRVAHRPPVDLGDRVRAKRRHTRTRSQEPHEVEGIRGRKPHHLAAAAPHVGRARRRSTASGLAYCSPANPVTKRPLRIMPRAYRRRNAHRTSRTGVRGDPRATRSRNTTPQRAWSRSATASARASGSSVGLAPADSAQRPMRRRPKRSKHSRRCSRRIRAVRTTSCRVPSRTVRAAHRSTSACCRTTASPAQTSPSRARHCPARRRGDPPALRRHLVAEGTGGVLPRGRK
jgi:hypothetical protein